MKHRFGRMESHLTSLAKTVAQISLELRTMHAIEDIIYALSIDMQHLKAMHMAASGGSMTATAAGGLDTPSGFGVSHSNLIDMQQQQQQQQRRRSSSEPTLLDQIENAAERRAWELKQKREHYRSSLGGTSGGVGVAVGIGVGGDIEAFRASAIANPRKLKKLTK